MKTRLLKVFLLAPFIILNADAQDLFLKLDSYFLKPESRAVVRVLEGTFQGTQDAVTLKQVSDITLHSPDFSGPAVESISLDTNEKRTVMGIQTLGPGTYLVGVSTISRLIDRKAADFNDYLRDGGLADTLAQRGKNNELGKDVRERNTQHVRAIFQVGDKLSDHYKRRLNFPVELIPQLNPYSLKVGQLIPVLCLVDGLPVRNQFVMAGWESSDGKIHPLSARSGVDGIARFKLAGAGKWYVKMNQMKPLADPKLNYESKSATLTFEVRSKKG